ncbi:MAG: LicD family protein [Clostridia bacterium]|nr:LicD family protein [Clostridia bacterium]
MYAEFCGYQKLALDALKEFHRVCELNHILYSVAFGTMIGCIREGGQIPWDYDIDVMVPLEQRDDLVNALKKDLEPNFYFVCPEVDPKCRHYFIRVAPKGYRSEFLHVDVFYFTGAPDSEEERKRLAKRYGELCRHRYTRYVDVSIASYGKLRRRGILLLRKVQSYGYSMKKEYDEFHSCAKKYPLRESKYVLRTDGFGWGNIYNKGHFRIFYAEDFAATELMKTNCGEFRLFSGYDRILKEVYGDYMKRPPVESGIREIVKEMSRLRNSKL